MAMSIGDAVLKFVGDTTDLNAAFQQIEETSAAKLAPVQADVAAVNTALEGVAESATAAGAAIQGAGENAQAAGAAMQKAGEEGAQSANVLSEAQTNVARLTYENQVAQRTLQQALRQVHATSGDVASVVERLGQAQARAAQTSEALAIAQQELRAQTAGVATAETEAAVSAETMGVAMAEAGAETQFSMAEAKGSMALVSEEIGVKIPRHLRGFIAELPGVGKAMEVAFSGFALLMLVQILVEAAKKLTEFIADTYIYTETMKEAEKANAELNKALGEQADKLKQLKEQYDLIGKEGSAKTVVELQHLNEQWVKNEQAIRSALDTMWQYRQEQQQGLDAGNLYTITEEQFTRASHNLILFYADQKTMQQQFLNLAKQGDAELLQESIQHQLAIVAASKTASEARLSVEVAEARLRLATAKAGILDMATLESQAANTKYELDRKALEQELAILEKDPTRNADRARAVQAQIEELDAQHKVRLLKAETDLVKKKNELLSKPVETQQADVESIIPLTKAGQAIDALEKYFQQLGVKSEEVWIKEVQDAEFAFKKIKDSGTATAVELMQLEDQLAKKKLGLAIAKGDLAQIDQLKKQIADLTKELAKYGIAADGAAKKNEHLNLSWASGGKALDTWAMHVRNSNHDMDKWTKGQQVADNVMGQFSQTFGGAVEAFVLGQESFGKALEQGLAQEAATIAGKAAMWALYFAAWGVADLFWDPPRAGADFTAAAEFGAIAVIAGAAAYGLSSAANGGSSSGNSSSASTDSTTATAPAAPSPNPVQTTNLAHFAMGGLVSGPTLAVIGDSINGAMAGPGQREAAIPLDDPQATGAIADALSRRNQTVHIHVQGLVTASTVDQFIGLVNKRVSNNNVRLVATTSRRVEKK
jgi:hypothetical protein